MDRSVQPSYTPATGLAYLSPNKSPRPRSQNSKFRKSPGVQHAFALVKKSAEDSSALPEAVQAAQGL